MELHNSELQPAKDVSRTFKIESHTKTLASRQNAVAAGSDIIFVEKIE